MQSFPYFYAEKKLSIIKTLITNYESYAKWTSVRRKTQLVDTD